MASTFNFVPYDVTYKIIEEEPIIYLFGKTSNNKKICLLDKFTPYFYAEVDNSYVEEKIKKLEIKDKDRTIKVKGVEKVKKKILGKTKELLKINCFIPADVPKIRDEIKNSVVETYEYDIVFTRRYLINKEIIPLQTYQVEAEEMTSDLQIPAYKINSIESTSSEAPPLNVLALDIETYNPKGKEFSFDNPILMVALYSDGVKKVITWKKFEGEDVEYVEGERELLERFSQIIHQTKPDLITGYSSDGFDLPYIQERAKHHKVKLKLGMDNSEMSVRDEKVSIKGLPHIDLLKFVRITMGRSLETDSYTLDEVAFELLGAKKDDVQIENLAFTWDNEPHKLREFAYYNLQDARLTYDLFQKLYPNMKEMVSLVGVAPFDVVRMGFSQMVEWFLIRQAKNYDEVVLNKPKNEEIRERRRKHVKGAFVFQPEPGLYENLVVFDFRSLYPTIITSHNIGPTALNCKCNDDEVYKNPENENIWFCKKTQALIPSVLEDVIRRRMRIKQILKENPNDPFLSARVYTLKILANSFYGYLGFFGSRWYSFECLETVTSFGRYYIKKVIDKAEKEGYKVVYSDTDSIFLALEKNTRDKVHKFIHEINEELPGLMELEYEGFYPSGIFVSAKEGSQGAKKRYALNKEKGELKITGFESVRRNTSRLAKETQEEILKIILENKDKEGALKYAKDVIKNLKEKKYDNKELVIRTRISRPLDQYDSIGPHVVVAKRLEERGQTILPGSIIEYIITSGEGIIRDRAKLLDEVEQGEYDSEYYINNQIIPAIEKIFEVLGYKKEDLLGEGSQKNLNSFFG